MDKRRVFAKTIDCQRALYQIGIDEKFECYRCGNKQHYLNRKDYSKMCTMCKSKTMVTRDTIFHNLRFGLLKGFKIMDEMEKSDYKLSSVFISRKFGITQSTSWKFLNKVKKNKDFVSGLLDKEIGRRVAKKNVFGDRKKDNINLKKLNKIKVEFKQDPIISE